MSVESVVSRIAELHSALAPQPAQTVARTTAPANVQNPAAFASMLQSAGLGTLPGATPVGAAGAGSPSAMVAAAQGEVGQAEMPPGSNASPRIAEYRSATAGSPGPGPWCAYFVSWAARQAGTPIGDHGE